MVPLQKEDECAKAGRHQWWRIAPGLLCCCEQYKWRDVFSATINGRCTDFGCGAPLDEHILNDVGIAIACPVSLRKRSL